MFLIGNNKIKPLAEAMSQDLQCETQSRDDGGGG